MHTPPRVRAPEIEHDHLRDPILGYDPPEAGGFLRCLAHGIPSPLVRWHHHEEYELHLIMETSGKVFVGEAALWNELAGNPVLKDAIAAARMELHGLLGDAAMS